MVIDREWDWRQVVGCLKFETYIEEIQTVFEYKLKHYNETNKILPFFLQRYNKCSFTYNFYQKARLRV